MAANDRPGGLTALSVLNGFFALSVGGATISRFLESYKLMQVLEHGIPGGEWRGRYYYQKLLDEGLTPLDLQILGVMGLTATVLLLVSIWGFLKQNNVLGRWLGTIGGVALACVSVCSILWLPQSYLKGSGISIARQMFYPLFLIFMLHVIFRRDFLNQQQDLST
ncbi:MAG: hypothetical protein GWP35_02240 [Proteobacteria bacterium]|nr:hypothetical protein [Pseudomonadota bacterium]